MEYAPVHAKSVFDLMELLRAVHPSLIQFSEEPINGYRVSSEVPRELLNDHVQLSQLRDLVAIAMKVRPRVQATRGALQKVNLLRHLVHSILGGRVISRQHGKDKRRTICVQVPEMVINLALRRKLVIKAIEERDTCMDVGRDHWPFLKQKA